ncbi:MAG: phosphoglycerate kinase [Alphaproteobacteria bacterium]|nr:phosphoglycerate kinase [Alphaproteobacteria bacterium]
MSYRTLDDLNVAGKRVLVRVDINVPIKDGKVTDATRIERVVPTIRELAGKGARVILLAHFGRPKGQIVSDMSLAPVAEPLSKALGRPVLFAANCIGQVAQGAVQSLHDGEVVLLENTRFHAGEEKNDKDFANNLAELGELYVNDAFSAAHRAHASTEALAHLLPSAAGRGMQAELDALGKALRNPQRPLAAVVGGAKISSKLDLLGNLVQKADFLIIGGGMANTFLAALGKPVGASLCEHDLGATAREILDKAKAAGCEVLLPEHVVVAKAFKAGAASRSIPIGAIEADDMILDVGSAAVSQIIACFEKAKTLVWNGPLGAFEIAPFDAGTVAAAAAAAKLTRAGRLLSVAGGGDTVAALNQAGAADDFSYVSTAGGAFLEWLEGKELPGVKALETA